MIMAFVIAWSLLCVPGLGGARKAHADEEPSVPSVSGVAFMQTEATAWDVLKVDNLGDQAIYITVKKDEKPLGYPMKFTAAEDSNVSGDYTGAGEKIAQIVAVEILADEDEDVAGGQTARELLSDPDKHPVFTIEVRNTLMQEDPTYNGTIYPVYGKIVDSDGKSDLVLLGIRTADEDETKIPKSIGVGNSYYKQDTTRDSHAKSYSLQLNDGVDCVFDGSAFIVTYEENDESTVEGTINYVDINSGEIVKTESIPGIGEQPKTAEIKKSFTAIVPGTEDESAYYRTLSRLSGSKVSLSIAESSYTVNVIKVDAMDSTSYTVEIQYVDENDNLLWSDSIQVKGYGYRYTLPNTFSMNQASNVESSDGVNFYRLDKVIGGKVVDESSSDEGLAAQSENGGSIEAAASAGNGTALILTKDLTAADFVVGAQGQKVVKAVYQSQDATMAVDFTVVEIDGETGAEIGRVSKTVTPSIGFSYVMKDKTIGGKTYVPWSGNPDAIEYDWEDLAQGIDLMQYVYYVPEDYVMGDAYDITVQYMNIANGDVLRTETLAVNPEMTDYVEFVGEPEFSQDGNDYVRLAGQDSGIRHAYFSPNRVYTVYYRNVDDVISANTVITNTQIIETVLPGTGGTITAGPTLIEDIPGDVPLADVAGVAGGDAILADAGVTPGDGTVVINDDDNPLANLAGQDTATERTIEENENPLASFASISSAIAGGAAIALVIIGLVAFFLLRRRKKANESYGL